MTDKPKEEQKNKELALDAGRKLERSPVRLKSSVVMSSEPGTSINRKIVREEIYNALNYARLPDEYQNVKLIVGVTSAERGDGKTVTAANLAVSFALGYNKRTVLVDLNMENPFLHEVFGVNQHPGLVESFDNGSIFLSQTQIDQLYLLPSGDESNFSLGLDKILGIRQILQSLIHDFDIVVVDMNSLFPIRDFPMVLANEFDGLLLVINTQKTKYSSIERIFRHINTNQALGFVFNNVDDDTI